MTGSLVLAAILAFALLSFILEWVPVDVTALATLALLVASGLVSGEAAVRGFANPAVITVMMLFVLSEGLVRSGVVRRMGHAIIRRAGDSSRRGTVLLLGLTGLASGFINNTAAVSMLIPVGRQLSRHFGHSASKILLPLSYAGILGGTLTLIGTSTNLLVSALAEERGLASFGVFEFLPLGAVFLGLGLVYLLLVGRRGLPERQPEEGLSCRYDLGGFVSELEVRAASPLVGSTSRREGVAERFGVSLLGVARGRERLADGLPDLELAAGDVLVVQGEPRRLLDFRDFFGLGLAPVHPGHDGPGRSGQEEVLAEVQVSPRSRLPGLSVCAVDFRQEFGVTVLGLGRASSPLRRKLSALRLRSWDVLLVVGPRDRVEALQGEEEFVGLERVGRPLAHPRWWLPLLVVPAVVGAAALGLASILEASLLGVATLLLTGTLRVGQAYRSIDWSVVFLIACLLPLSGAMESTGLSRQLGLGVVAVGERLGPVAVLSLVFLVTALTTEVLSNNAAAIVMVPVAQTVAESLGVDPKPFLIAVCYAGSASFLTPMGYQTNAMVYGPGGYRFVDYLRFGWPLKLVLWLVATALIPVMWPF